MKPVTVQERVSELVAEHGSYRAAAKALGMDHAYLYRIGNGCMIPRPKMLSRLRLDAKAAIYKRLRG